MTPLSLSTIRFVMARKKEAPEETIGDRIRLYRKLKGLTQTQLGEIVGISQRLMTYYEAQDGSPSADLLIRFAKALDVPVNVLAGVESQRRSNTPSPESVRLWRRFQRLEELPPQDKKAVLKMIDALADRRKRRTG